MALTTGSPLRRESHLRGRSSILSDDLVRKLVPVGQVDILVGVPTFNNAPTISSVVKTLHIGLAKHFPRERTVLINPDGGSDDGTPELVRSAPMADEEMRGSTTLRTTHRVSARYAGHSGAAAGVRTVFAAADLLQARVVVVIDADVTSMTPDWVADLARPIWNRESDLVLPIYPRGRFDGPLVSQLVRPLLGTAYGRRLHSNLGGEFSCSGLFAARMVGHPMWENDISRAALDVWLVATAMAEDLRLAQVHLGARRFAAQVTLTELFERVVGTALTCLERHSSIWPNRSELLDVPVLGEARGSVGAESTVDPVPMWDRFRSGVEHLAPLLREVLRDETLARLTSAAASTDGALNISDALWVTTVFEFAAAAHRGVMHLEHLTQALVPLYLGRTASFFSEIALVEEDAFSRRLTELEREYERMRPSLVELWNADGKR